MTSLARQLQALALPGVNYETELRKRPSFLFDSQKAATLDRDALHAVGVNGFEGLCSIDSSFADEFSSLFDESSKGIERSVMMKEENETLGRLIGQFLRRAAPYFQSRSTHKCLEWLIYRMRIQHFNANDLLISFLPYHRTKIFVRLLQLIDPAYVKKKWAEITPDMSQPPTKTMIVEKCSSDYGFFSDICNNVVKSIIAHEDCDPKFGALRPAVNLYAVFALETIFHLKKKQNNFLATLFPFIVKGLESSVPDFRYATYMVITLLSIKVSLTEKVLVSILDILSKIYAQNLEFECLQTISIISHWQEKVKLSQEFVDNLCEEKSNLLPHLDALNKVSNIEKFLVLFINTDSGTGEGYQSISLSLIKVFTLSKSSQEAVIHSIFEKCVVNNSESNTFLFKLLILMHRKYPESFTFTTRSLVKLEKYKNAINDVMNSLMGETESEEAMDCSVLPLVLNIESRGVEDRTSSLKFLKQMLTSRSELSKSVYVRQALKDCLANETSPVVVNSALDILTNFPDVLFCNHDDACTSLISLLFRIRGESQWEEVAGVALKLLTSQHFESCSEEVTSLISLCVCDTLLHKVALSVNSFDVAELRKSFFAKKNSWIFTINWKKDLKAIVFSMTKVVKENLKIFENLKQSSLHVSQLLGNSKQDTFSRKRVPFEYLIDYAMMTMFMTDKDVKNNLGRSMSIALELLRDIKGWMSVRFQKLDKGIPKNDDDGINESTDDFASMFLVMVIAFSQNKDPFWMIDSTLKFLFLMLAEMLKMLKHGFKTTSKDVYSQWEIMTKNTEKVVDGEMNFEEFNGNLCHKSLELILDCLSFVKFGLESGVLDNMKTVARLLLAEYFTGPEEAVTYLSFYWSSANLPTQTRVQALHFATSIIRQNSIKLCFDGLMKTDCTFVPNLLIALSSDVSVIRGIAMGLLVKILESDVKGGFAEIIKFVSENKELVIADGESLLNILPKFFSLKKSGRYIGKPVLESLLQHHIDNKSASLKLRVQFLKVLKRVSSEMISISLAPTLEDYLNRWISGDNFSSDEIEFVSESLLKIDHKCIKTKAVHDVFWKALKCDTTSVECDGASFQSVVLEVVTKDFFANLNNKTQKELFHSLIVIASENPSAVKHITRVFKTITIDANLVGDEIVEFLKVNNDAKPTPAKRKRTTDTFTQDKSPEWSKLLLLMEFLQEKKKISNLEALLEPLFKLFGVTLLSINDDDEFDKIDYMQQLILTLLHNIILKLKESADSQKHMGDVIKNACKVQDIIHCVRASENTQLQHQALLVLSEISTLFPDKVLDNVMAIFTFMGSHMLRKDDSYSFQIISTTIQVMIPALIKVEGAMNRERTILRIINAFVDSLPDVPPHRRNIILQELLDTLGAQRYLWILILLLGNLMVRKTMQDAKKTEEMESQPRLSYQEIFDITVSVCEHETVEIQLQNVLKCAEHLLTVPFDKEGQKNKASSTLSVIETKTLSTIQLRKFYVIMYTSLSNIMQSNSENVTVLMKRSVQSAGEMDTDTAGHNNMEILLQNLYEACLEQMHKATSYAESSSDADLVKFSKAVITKCSSFVRLVNSFLPFNKSLGMFEMLLRKDNIFLKQKSLELLGETLSNMSENLQESDVLSVANISKELANMVLDSYHSDSVKTTEGSALCYTALVTLKLSIRNCGKLRPDCFTEVLEMLCEIITVSGSDDTQVLSSVFLCLAEMCSCLRAYCIPHLNSFVPLLLDKLSDTHTLQSNSLLFSCLTTLHRLLENLLDFTSRYLGDIIDKITTLLLLKKFSSENDFTDGVVSHITMRLKVIVSILATKVPPRILITVLVNAQKKDAGRKIQRIKPLCSIILKHVECLNRDKMVQSLVTLQPLIYAIMEFRESVVDENEDLVEDVEELVTEVALKVMLKLPETSFRVVYFGLSEWSSVNQSPERFIVFYKLILKLSMKMKGLFSLFATTVIDTSAGILRDDALTKNYDLIKLVCVSLLNIFQHDTSGILTKEKFELLFQPLVELFDSVVTFPSFDALVRESVIPLLAQIALSVTDDSCQKILNYKILLKSRHLSPNVRKLSLKAVESVAEKLGEDYTAILPESIPFLSELLEDDQEDVENDCHAVIRHMEKILGEPLQKYFTQ